METERRHGMSKLFQDVQDIKLLLEVEFGSKDLAGRLIEGKLITRLKDIDEKLKIQNGRVATSEGILSKLPCSTREAVLKNNAWWLNVHLVGLWSCICGIVFVVYEVIKHK